MLALDCCNCAATADAATSLDNLTALRFTGCKLSFPWQHAHRLKEAVLLGDENEYPTMRGSVPVHGTTHLTALMGLRSLTLELPLDELPSSTAWLGSVTNLETHVIGPGRTDGIDQVGNCSMSVPKCK